jgi:hypothetical protein
LDNINFVISFPQSRIEQVGVNLRLIQDHETTIFSRLFAQYHKANRYINAKINRRETCLQMFVLEYSLNSFSQPLTTYSLALARHYQAAF